MMTTKLSREQLVKKVETTAVALVEDCLREGDLFYKDRFKVTARLHVGDNLELEVMKLTIE